MTQKHIAKKQKLAEAGLGQAKKEVDRKATKGRKIKYVVHDKLKNFMVPDENWRLMENKNEVVKRLFGKSHKSLATKKLPQREPEVRLI